MQSQKVFDKLMLDSDDVLRKAVSKKNKETLEAKVLRKPAREDVELEVKVLDENVELTYVHYGKRQYNKTLTEGGLLFRDYIKSKLQELKGVDN